jgi:hypothetical protein
MATTPRRTSSPAPLELEGAHTHIYRETDAIPGILSLREATAIPADIPLVYYVQITPDLAAHWLQRSAKALNRKLKWSVARRYARDMQAGKWTMSCQGIEFDREGLLLNGQHRLHAIVSADMPITLLVGFGVQPEAQRNIDTNATRSLGDAFHLVGVRDAGMVSTIVRVLVMVEKAGTWEAYHDYGYSPTRAECWAYWETHRDIEEVITLTRSLRVCLHASIGGPLLYTTSKTHPVEAHKFWRGMADGVGLGGADIRHLLRERLIKDRQAKHAKMVEKDIVAFTIKAWNCYLEGKEGNWATLRWRSQGPVPELFPQPL